MKLRIIGIISHYSRKERESMKIKAIFTGGTIGSRLGEDGRIAPEGEMKYRLLDWYEGKSSSKVTFLATEPYYILSENLSANELCLLIQAVKDAVNQKAYDGIVIMHGTDTLQYTAAMLSYVFADVRIPIVLISSDYPLEDTRANGYDNFYYGVEFIKGAYGTGVFVSYRNGKDVPIVHHGRCLLAHTAYSARVESVCGNIFGCFEKNTGKFKYNSAFTLPTEKKIQIPFEREIMLRETSDEILRIVPYVGMKYPVLDERVKVVLHESYHSGTIDVQEQLQQFAAEAKARGIPIYLIGLSNDDAEYETVEQYRKFGVIPVGGCAAIALYCKLWLGLSNGFTVEEMM